MVLKIFDKSFSLKSHNPAGAGLKTNTLVYSSCSDATYSLYY